MKRTIWICIVIAILFALNLTACQRPASVAPVATATTGSDLPFPVPATQNPMQMIMTQTANAKNGPTQAVITRINPTSTVTMIPISKTQNPVVIPTNTEEIKTVPTTTPEPVQTGPTQTPYVGTVPSSYTVHDGDYPYCIARRFDISISDLLAANGLDENSELSVGETLTIPSDANEWEGGSRTLYAHPDTFIVEEGDTVYSIACEYGDVYPEAIIAANNLSDEYDIEVGQEIKIP